MRIFWRTKVSKILTVWLCLVTLQSVQAWSGESIGTATGAEAQTPKNTVDPRQSYGVFIGVDDFDETALRHLRYSAADAQAVQNCFINDLNLIPETNARLLVSRAEGQNTPKRANIMNALVHAAEKAGPGGIIIVYLSTHSLEGGVIVEDSHLSTLRETGVALENIQRLLESSSCPRQLLILDGCREVKLQDPCGKAKGAIATGREKAFAQSFTSSERLGILMSCSKGEVSYEMESVGHGTFTHFLLAGLRGAAPAEPDGSIRLAGLAGWLKPQVEQWSLKHGACGVQSPQLDLRLPAGDISLSSRKYLQE